MMKRYTLVLFLTVTVFLGCKKDKLNSNEVYNQKIQGKWDVVMTKSITFENGEKIEDEEKFQSGTNIFEFAGNTLNYIPKNSTKQVYQFSLEGDEVVLRGNDDNAFFFRFKFSSDTQLELTQIETRTQDNVTYEESFSFIMNKIQ